MPTLEDLRAWARGVRVKGFPDPSPRKKVPKPPPPQPAGPGVSRQYRINIDGDDALLLFGKFKGSRVSEMVGVSRQKRYLRWMLAEDFPEDLKSVIRYYLDPGPK